MVDTHVDATASLLAVATGLTPMLKGWIEDGTVGFEQEDINL